MAEQEICGICRDSMEDNMHTLECGHVFHKSCIHSWVIRCNQCPYCRRCVKTVSVRVSRIYSDEELEFLIHSYEFLEIAREQELSDYIRRLFMATVSDSDLRDDVIAVFSECQELDLNFILDHEDELCLDLIIPREEELSLPSSFIAYLEHR